MSSSSILLLPPPVKKMEVDYIEEIFKPVIGRLVSSYTDFGVEMVGNSSDIREKLVTKMMPVDMWIVSFLGEVGSGRTHAARIFFEDQCNSEERLFECCAWVTVGNYYELERVLICILDQILDNPAGDYEMFRCSDLSLYLNMILKSRRYLIVLDDVRDEEVINYFEMFRPDQGNGSLVIYTTSSERISQWGDMVQDFKHFFEETAWFILRDVIFSGESMSPECVEYGKKIIDICPPARIPMAKMLLFLYKTKKSPEKWSKIATDKENPIFMVEDEISEVGILKRELQSFTVMDDRRAEDFAYFVSPSVESYDFIEPFKMMIQPERFFDKMQILSLWGMAGIGKTTLAKKIFKDESIICRFDNCVWITLGQNYQPEEILIDILAQVYPSTDKMLIKGDEKLARNLCSQLAGKRCFIVLDDLWSKEPLIRLKDSFPNITGTTLVTTRMAKVAKFGRDDTLYEMKLLDNEESWCLLREKVFAQGLCSPELEKVGRKIAAKCEGLPLLILTVADQLLKVKITEEYWNSVALGKEKSVFMNANHEINKNMLPIHWYEFPDEVVKLIHLRYLSLTCNGELPTSISKLWKLQHLIVKRDTNSISFKNCVPLPMEIWDMKELKHLQVMGGLLPNPKYGDGLPNLSTLLDVSAQSCTKKVLKRIPNLKRLSIKIEMAPDEKGNPFYFLNNISQLQRLESLKCAVTNPHIRSDIVPPELISMFPSSLKELSLSGFGYPWEYMSTIGKLKQFEVLKLKQYAFRGPKWGNMGYTIAHSEVKFLLVEDTDLVHWDPNAADFSKLERLSIKHCYKLQEPPLFTNRSRFKMLEIVDCSPSTVRWAENVTAMVEGEVEVKVRLSWIDEKCKE